MMVDLSLDGYGVHRTTRLTVHMQESSLHETVVEILHKMIRWSHNVQMMDNSKLCYSYAIWMFCTANTKGSVFDDSIVL